MKDYEKIPSVEEKGKRIVINVCDTELNNDWIRSARLDPGSEGFKALEKGEMVRALTEKEGDKK